LIERLGLGDKLEWLPTSNSFHANRIYRLSTPLDLLRFSHLSLVDRIRMGLVYLSTRFVKDWRYAIVYGQRAVDEMLGAGVGRFP